MDVKQDFRWELQALRSLKELDFEIQFNAFFCKWDSVDEIEDEWGRETIFDYFMDNSVLKNVIHVSEYFLSIGSRIGDDFLLQNIIKKHVKSRGNYFKIGQIIAHLKLQDDFSFEEMLVPLFVGSHADVDFFEQYVGKDNTDLQIKLITWMDQTEDFNKIQRQSYPECKKPRNLSSNAFCKFLSKIAERFELDLEEVAPISCLSERKKDIKYWIRAINYENIVRGNWRDLMVKKAKQLQLKLFLIEELVKTKKNECVEEAAHFLHLFDIEQNLLGSQVLNAIETRPRQDLSPANKVYLMDESADFIVIDPDLEYFIVDDAKSFQDLCASLKVNYLWGMDCEFNADPRDSKVSLLQLANTSKEAYLVDMTSLVSVLDADAWHDFVEVILSGNNLFLAYDPREDFKNLARTTNAFKNLEKLSDLRNVLDMKALIESAAQKEILRLDAAGSSHYRGLSRMAEIFLEKPLDKRQQISDWDKRPLTQSQIDYAIIDAHVLILLYNAVYDRVEGNDEKVMALTQIESLLKRNGNKVIIPKPDKNHRDSDKENVDEIKEEEVESPEEPQKEPIKPPDLRVVCDNMLEGLCKQLRKCGVDAIAITSQDGLAKCAEIANNENRTVLTRQKRLQQLQKITQERCVAIKGDTAKDQLKEVLELFHVVDTTDYILSRCMKCNESKFNLVTRSELKTLQLKNIPPEAVIERHEEFYVCDKCSHVYWNGSHFSRVMEDLKQNKCS